MNQTGFVTFGGRLFSCCRPSKLPPDLQSNRLSSVICKIKNSGQMHWNILNGFFGPLEPILRTLQLPFTDNRIKSNFLVRPPRAPTFSSQFYQYSLFRTSPFAFPKPPGKQLAHHLCQSSICYIHTFVCTLSLFWIAFSLHLCFQMPTQIPPSLPSLAALSC